MNIIIVDDEKAALHMVEEAVREAVNEANVCTFSEASEAYEWACGNDVDVAFLDIRMHEMNGIELAKKIKRIHSKLNVVFITGFMEYGVDAVNVHASGYLQKPVDADDIKEAMENLLHPIDDKKTFYIRTFGNFDVMYDGKPVTFERTKAKELLAYLVDLGGASASRKELAAVLFEDSRYTRAQQNYFTKIYKSLRTALENIGQGDILVQDRNSYSVDYEKIDCDVKEYLEGTPNGLNKFRGVYMDQYSWADKSIGKFI